MLCFQSADVCQYKHWGNVRPVTQNRNDLTSSLWRRHDVSCRIYCLDFCRSVLDCWKCVFTGSLKSWVDYKDLIFLTTLTLTVLFVFKTSDLFDYRPLMIPVWPSRCQALTCLCCCYGCGFSRSWKALWEIVLGLSGVSQVLIPCKGTHTLMQRCKRREQL